MNIDWAMWLGLGLGVAVLIVLWLRTKPTTAAQALTQVQEASTLAKTLVMAAEQLWRTGRLPSEDRLDYVLDRLEAEFPGLDHDVAVAVAEAAVYWLKQFQPTLTAKTQPKKAA